jgi:hypothetical protein
MFYTSIYVYSIYVDFNTSLRSENDVIGAFQSAFPGCQSIVLKHIAIFRDKKKWDQKS